MVSPAAPDGESRGTFLFYASATRPGRFGIAAGINHYTMTKRFTDTSMRRMTETDIEWSVYQLSPFAEYRVPLRRRIGPESRHPRTPVPSLGLRAGASILPIQYQASAVDTEGVAFANDNETRIGTYVGLDLLYPWPNSRAAVFAVVDKTFAKSTLLTQEIDVGSLTVGAGVAYRFD